MTKLILNSHFHMPFLPKKAIDKQIYFFIRDHLSIKYEVSYKPFLLKLKKSNLKIDFYIQLREEFLPDKERPIEFFIQFTLKPTCHKLTQIYDLILSHSSVIVLWDHIVIKETLQPLINLLNKIVDQEKNLLSVFSPNLLFLMYCDQQDQIEMNHFHQVMHDFGEKIRHVEKENGIFPEQLTEEKDLMDGDE